MVVVRSGPVDGYLRPDQFLDHLTVIIKFAFLESLFVFVTKFFCTLSNKKVPQVETAL